MKDGESLVILLVVALLIFLFDAWIVKIAWAVVMPELFKLPELTFGQSIWLLILVNTLRNPSKVKPPEKE